VELQLIGNKRLNAITIN